MTLKRCLTAALFVFAMGPIARGEFLIGLTSTNKLITFDSATPGTFTPAITISGLAAGENIVGIDYRPATRQLYGLTQSGTGNRAITINPATGAINFSVILGTNLVGTKFGVDFNPTADRLRVTSNSGQNYRINVDTGAVTIDGGAGSIAYAVGDPNFGTPVTVVASAYTNNIAGGPGGTTLYDITTSGLLTIQNPPNNGTLMTVGALGAPVTPDASFDISGFSGRAFAVLDGQNLYEINRATGVATLLGNINSPGLVTGLAADLNAVPAPPSLILAGIAGFAGLVRFRRQLI